MIRLGTTLGLASCLLAAGVSACGEDAIPQGTEEQEFINEVTLTLMRRQDSTFQRAVISDPDGAGPLPWQLQQGTLHLAGNASYTATITLTNSTVAPPVDVTPLINAKKLQHRFFYTVDPEGGVLATDLTIDGNSAEYGEAFAIHVPAGTESRSWTLHVLLSHYEGDAKGNGLVPAPLTDVEVTFRLET
jgi:hypothetical protein